MAKLWRYACGFVFPLVERAFSDMWNRPLPLRDVFISGYEVLRIGRAIFRVRRLYSFVLKKWQWGIDLIFHWLHLSGLLSPDCLLYFWNLFTLTMTSRSYFVQRALNSSICHLSIFVFFFFWLVIVRFYFAFRLTYWHSDKSATYLMWMLHSVLFVCFWLLQFVYLLIGWASRLHCKILLVSWQGFTGNSLFTPKRLRYYKEPS